jgi:hypothetical protein
VIPLNVTIENQQFIAVDYWWEDNDFIVIADNNEIIVLVTFI